MSNLINFYLRINQRMSSRAPAWNHYQIQFVFNYKSIQIISFRAPSEIHTAQHSKGYAFDSLFKIYIEQQQTSVLFFFWDICNCTNRKNILRFFLDYQFCLFIKLNITAFLFLYDFWEFMMPSSSDRRGCLQSEIGCMMEPPKSINNHRTHSHSCLL